MRKFKGVPSECLIMPLDIEIDPHVGIDIAELKGIKKYEKELPTSLSGIALGNFPTGLIPKTDEPNFQTVEHMIEALQGQQYYATVKADGSSGTIYKHDGHFGCCSRNLEFKPSDKTAVWVIAKNYDLENKLPDNYAIQFEMCGSKIQKNRLGLKAINGFIFNVYNIEHRQYLDAEDVFQFAKDINMPTVDVEVWNEVFNITDSNVLRTMAEGVYKSGKIREGLVFRPMKEQFINYERLSFKVINLMYKD
jgi:RNA ligase (TIGR02306 family)